MGTDIDATSTQPTTLVGLLQFRASYQADQVAYTFLQDGETQAKTLTYQELDRRAQVIATKLQSMDALGERALLLYPPGLDYIVAFFGCLYAGVVAVPAYPPRPNRSMVRLQSIFRDAQSKLALTTLTIMTGIEKTLEQSPDLKKLSWITTDEASDEKTSKSQTCSRQKLRVEQQSLAFLQYTSGSTAAPKGVVISHENLMHNLQLISQCFGHTPQSRGVIWLPPYHDMGLIGGILAPLYAGFPVVLMSPLIFLQRPVRWLKAIVQYQATVSGAPNFAYDLCVQKVNSEDLVGIDLSSWEVAFNGAEPVQAECLERFAHKFEPYGFRREAFYPCYGMAEASLIISGGLKSALPLVKAFDSASLEQHRVKLASGHAGDVKKIVGCGQALPEQDIVIVHPEKQICCQAGEVGEIWVQGPSIAKGYWNQPEKTQQTFEAYLADVGTGPFMRTGDLGFITDGELYVTGRLKDLIIINGHNHYPQDIERTVERSHSSLRLHYSAAFSVEVNHQEAVVIAAEVERCYMSRKKGLLNQKVVVKAIRKAVAEQHRLSPQAVVLLKFGSIPKTSSGKIQRYQCRHGFLQGTLATL